MKFKKTIPDDVQEVICDGLRTAINVHVILQEALDLRVPKKELPLFAMLPWDQEDEELLASSMKDINADFSKSD